MYLYPAIKLNILNIQKSFQMIVTLKRNATKQIDQQY